MKITYTQSHENGYSEGYAKGFKRGMQIAEELAIVRMTAMMQDVLEHFPLTAEIITDERWMVLVQEARTRWDNE